MTKKNSLTDTRNERSRPRTWTEWNDDKLEKLARWIREAETVVWFTGAGISTESGLPDYRGPTSTRARAKRGLPRITHRPLPEIEPNAAHFAIVEFEKMGKCDFLVSQNVDNLHLKSGYPFDKLAELHGNQSRLRCRPCGQTFPLEDFQTATGQRKRGDKGRFVSCRCPICGRNLKSSVINFGDAMPEEDLAASFDWARKADVIIVVGSSCKVHPAADVPRATKESGGRLAIVNIGKTGLDDMCDLRFSDQKAGVLLPKVLNTSQEQTAE